jgi:hypothetical protein
MKRCPECRRDYYDDTLSFCLEDGTPLVYGVSADEPATAILSEPGVIATGFRAGEAPTKPHIISTDQTAILRTEAEAEPQKILGELSERQSHSAHQAAEPLKKRGGKFKPLVILGAALLLVIGGIGFAVYKFWGRSDKPPQMMKIERLTTNGKSVDAAISPDGKYVVYVLDEGGQQSLWTRQVATTSNVQIIPPADVPYRGLGFTPDGNYINFLKREKADVPLALYQMPLLGGIQKKLVSNIFSGVAYAPEAFETLPR